MVLIKVVGLGLGLVLAWGAQAQATRTWVSGVGDDVNPCSRTAPCKTFAGAISKTAAQGEISVLDPGGFGVVTITKSITINGEGTLGSVVNSLTNGFVINGANVVVVLRHLTIQGSASGLSGVKLLSGSQLHMEHVTIMRQGGSSNMPAVDLSPNTAAQVSMSDVAILGCSGSGIQAAPSGGNALKVHLQRVRVAGCSTGLTVANDASVMLSASSLTGNSTGLAVSGSGSAQLSDTNIASDNTVPCTLSGSGGLVSWGNNRLAAGCTPTSTSGQR